MTSNPDQPIPVEDLNLGSLVEHKTIAVSNTRKKAAAVLNFFGLDSVAKKVAPPDLKVTFDSSAVEVKILEDNEETVELLEDEIIIFPFSAENSLIIPESSGSEQQELLAVSNTAIIRKMATLIRNKYQIITGQPLVNLATNGDFNARELIPLMDNWKIPIFLATTGSGEVDRGHFVLPLKFPPIWDESQVQWKISVFDSLKGGQRDLFLPDWNPEKVTDYQSFVNSLIRARLSMTTTVRPILEKILSQGNLADKKRGDCEYDLTHFPPELNHTFSPKVTATQEGMGVIDCGLYDVIHGAILSSIANPLHLFPPIDNERMRRDFAQAMDQNPDDPKSGIKIATIEELYNLLGVPNPIENIILS